MILPLTVYYYYYDVLLSCCHDCHVWKLQPAKIQSRQEFWWNSILDNDHHHNDEYAGLHHNYHYYNDEYAGQVTHTLEEESPLFNFTPGQLLKAKMELIVCLEVGINMKMIIMIMMRTIARINFCLGVIINQGIMMIVILTMMMTSKMV